MSRRQIRTKVMQACFAKVLSENTVDEVFASILSDNFQALSSTGSSDYDPEDAVFLKDLFFGTMKHFHPFQELLETKLENWEQDRIALVDKILIMMGFYEMLYCPDIPVKVTINEYVDIAKIYSTEKSNKFINGILDAFYFQFLEEKRIVKAGKGLIEQTV